MKAHLECINVADAGDGWRDHGGLGEAVELAVGGVPVFGCLLRSAGDLGSGLLLSPQDRDIMHVRGSIVCKMVRGAEGT